uniref:Uncharacterized protein n=1 Tax=Solanum tuberosum TaxID=4113 RepID=M1CRS4_SOLTU
MQYLQFLLTMNIHNTFWYVASHHHQHNQHWNQSFRSRHSSGLQFTSASAAILIQLIFLHDPSS